MARKEQTGALAVADDVASYEPNDPRFARTTMLPPPPPPVEDDDLIGPSSGIFSLEALEAALDALPFGDESDGIMVRLGDESSGEEDEGPPDERPTKRYTIPDVPPCLRATSRPHA
jgi:hypothetical protein